MEKKWKKEDIEALFPRKCLVTGITGKSVGEELLKSFIPEELWEDTFWGLSIGNVGSVKIKTETLVEHEGRKIKVPLYLDKNLEVPTEITFELRK